MSKITYHKVVLFVFCLFFLIACNSDDNPSETPPVDPINSNPNVELTTSTTVSDTNGNTYEVGFNQVSSINQDTFVRKKNANGESVWYVEHETSEVDGRATLIFIDNTDTPWVVFTLVGGSYSDDYLTKRELSNSNAFKSVYEGSYGNGGGAKVSIIAKLDPNTGKIVKGSFVIAKKSDGKTNGLIIKSIGMVDGQLAFTANTAAWPPGEGSSYNRFPNITDADRINNSFKLYYEMSTDLKTISHAELRTE